MEQRYYDPGIGMFLSVDPVTAYSSPVGQFHRYRYANNNPYRFTDPDGRFALDDKEEPPPPPEPEKEKVTTLPAVPVTGTRPAPNPRPVSIPWGRIGRSLIQGGSIPLTFITGMWPYDMGYAACEMPRGPPCGLTVYNESEPSETDLTKVKERDGNKVAQDAGYDDAHDAKKGRGEGGVDIYRDKSGKHWLWNGVPGGEKDAL